MWNKILKPIVVLCTIAIIVTGALAVTNEMTAPVIAAATAAAQEAARTELLPEATSFTKVDGVFDGVSDVYVADNGVGTVITCAANGYGGAITVMVAFSPDGVIDQIKITSQSETAGLGTKITTEPTFQSSFAGIDSAFTVDDIDAISGATISSKATVTAVNYAIAAYAAIS